MVQLGHGLCVMGHLHGIHGGCLDLAQHRRLLGYGTQQIVERRTAKQRLKYGVDIAIIGTISQTTRPQTDGRQISLMTCQKFSIFVCPLI